MTAQEKFEARLKELGLWKNYGMDDHVGTVLPDGRIIVLVHIQTDPRDSYTEIEYPPFEELWKDGRFRKECKEHWYKESADWEFIGKLAYWLDIHDEFAKCPLFPVDLYWMGTNSKWFNYEDDDTAEDIIKNLVAEHSAA